MILELIYTSAPKGLKPGSRGFCTVARTAGFPAGLDQTLESISGYRWLESQPTSLQPVNFMYSVLQAGGRSYRVLSRIGDAGADYSGRTNKCAHHLALTEAADMPPAGPAWVAQRPGLFETQWASEPEEFPANRKRCRTDVRPSQPAYTWANVAGDAGWAGVVAQRVFDSPGAQIALVFNAGQPTLALIDEVLALLPSDRRWQTTFSTYLTDRPTSTCNLQCVLPDSALLADLRRNPQAWILDLSTSGTKVLKGDATLTAPNAGARVGWARTGAPANLNAPPAVQHPEAAKSAGAAKKIIIGASVAAKSSASEAMVAEQPPSIHVASSNHATVAQRLEPTFTTASKGVPWLGVAIVAGLIFATATAGLLLIRQSKQIPRIDLPPESHATPDINEAPEIVVTELPPGTVGKEYKSKINTKDGADHFKIDGLPEGLKYGFYNGEIEGLPTKSFDGKIAVKATRGGRSVSAELRLVIQPAAPQLTPMLPITLHVGEEVKGQIFAKGDGHLTYTINEPSPKWIRMTENSFSGTPPETGKYIIEYSVSNSGGTVTDSLIITVLEREKSATTDINAFLNSVPKIETNPNTAPEATNPTKIFRLHKQLAFDEPRTMSILPEDIFGFEEDDQNRFNKVENGNLIFSIWSKSQKRKLAVLTAGSATQRDYIAIKDLDIEHTDELMKATLKLTLVGPDKNPVEKISLGFYKFGKFLGLAKVLDCELAQIQTLPEDTRDLGVDVLTNDSNLEVKNDTDSKQLGYNTNDKDVMRKSAWVSLLEFHKSNGLYTFEYKSNADAHLADIKKCSIVLTKGQEIEYVIRIGKTKSAERSISSFRDEFKFELKELSEKFSTSLNSAGNSDDADFAVRLEDINSSAEAQGWIERLDKRISNIRAAQSAAKNLIQKADEMKKKYLISSDEQLKAFDAAKDCTRIADSWLSKVDGRIQALEAKRAEFLKIKDRLANRKGK